MAFKGESYIPLIVRVKPAEGDIWRVRDNGMLFGIPLKGGDFIEWTGSAWQLRPDLHYKLDDGSIEGVQDEAIALEFEPLDEDSYAEGTKRMYNGLLYIRNNTAGDDTEWVASHWTQTNVMAQIPNPMYGMPLVKGANGIVTNNGRSLVVTGTNAWAEGNGTVNQVQCTADVTDANVVPLSSVARIQPGMIFDAVGGYEHPGDCHITAIDYANNTVTVGQLVSIAEDTVVTIKTGATGLVAHSEGLGNSAEGDYSHAEGKYTIARGHEAHAEGGYTAAAGVASHSEGNTTVAFGNYSHAEGSSTIAYGATSHVGGEEMVAGGSYSFAHGKGTFAYNVITACVFNSGTDKYDVTLDSDIDSDWYDRNQKFVLVGDNLDILAQAEPLSADSVALTLPGTVDAASLIGTTMCFPATGAFGYGAVAIGDATTLEDNAVAVGKAAIAAGYGAIAMNGGNAAGDGSFAVGTKANPTGMDTIALGTGTRMDQSNGIALGKYNDDDSVPFVIGQGYSNDTRADIFKIDNDKHVWICDSNGTLVDLTALLITANILP